MKHTLIVINVITTKAMCITVQWYRRGNRSYKAMVNTGKLEQGFGMISAGIPSTLPQAHEDNDVPTFWHLLPIQEKTKPAGRLKVSRSGKR